MNSPSTLTSTRTAQGVTVAYKNKTTSSLVCTGMSAPAEVIGVVDAHVKEYGERSLTDAAMGELQPKVAELEADAAVAGRMFGLNADGSVSGGGMPSSPGSGSEFIEPGASVTWVVPAPSGYTAEALLVCVEPDMTPVSLGEVYSYAEYVSTPGSGGLSARSRP
ncbi:hypothetical protein [Rhodococcus sp. IEGM 1408]|uniref:hypothetical protein n=1 Tax=Rhodococcus sp. IEGM 1408 TaxID=3082220 RepID=UPI002953FB52|nr:hypothetical protein [Rhodococcus sp. IEGM 1408]MDV8001659.1 hypothetical protein [Rhodococcus sp. IEGM 1408]